MTMISGCVSICFVYRIVLCLGELQTALSHCTIFIWSIAWLLAFHSSRFWSFHLSGCWSHFGGLPFSLPIPCVASAHARAQADWDTGRAAAMKSVD